MPAQEAPCVELGNAPDVQSIAASPTASDLSSTSSPEPQQVHATPLFRALAMPPPEPAQPPGQEELERRLPGYRRIVIPRELTLIELLKECSGAVTDEEILRIRDARLRVVAERVGLRRLHVLAPRLKTLTLDGSALSSLRDLGIGLVHLKVLSVKRCGLTSLDGIWGMGTLRELHAAGNRLKDLQPLAALQKLHTLDLSENPISESTRLWTLAVCSSLRRLSLRGCPTSDLPQYRSRVASALPLLIYLDDRTLQTDTTYNSNDEIFGMPSSSDSETESKTPPRSTSPVRLETGAGPSSLTHFVQVGDGDSKKPQPIPSTDDINDMEVGRRRRPATTEGAGPRPRLDVPPRPRTAQALVSRMESGTTSRLQILNTLLDEEWRCSGSDLTSYGAVCGNLTRALRRPSTASRRRVTEEEAVAAQAHEESIGNAARAIAAEIPVLPCVEDWAKFRRETGIDIELDFNARPKSADPAKVMEKLEQIERETCERLRRESLQCDDEFFENPSNVRALTMGPEMPDADNDSLVNDMMAIDFNAWREIDALAPNIDQEDRVGNQVQLINTERRIRHISVDRSLPRNT